MIKGKFAKRLPDEKALLIPLHRPLLREGRVKESSVKPTAEPLEALCFHQRPWKRIKRARTNLQNPVSPKQKSDSMKREWKPSKQEKQSRTGSDLPASVKSGHCLPTTRVWAFVNTMTWKRNIQTYWKGEAAEDRMNVKTSTRTLPEIMQSTGEADGEAWISTTYDKGW